MAVYTNKDYNEDNLPEILKDYRWPQLFWVEDRINRPLQKRWVPICPPRSPNNYERMCQHFMNCLLHDEEPLVSGEDGARAIEVMWRRVQVDGNGWMGRSAAHRRGGAAVLQAVAGRIVARGKYGQSVVGASPELPTVPEAPAVSSSSVDWGVSVGKKCKAAELMQ